MIGDLAGHEPSGLGGTPRLIATRLVLKKPILPYLREVTRAGLPGFVEALMNFPDQEVLQNLTDFLGKRPTDFKIEEAMQDRFLSSCWSTITARLFPLFSPGILASSSGSDFFAADLIQQKTSLYLLFAEGDLEFTKTYLQLVWLSIVSRLIEFGDKLDGNIPVPLILGLDEAGVVPVPRLPKLLATIAGRGMNAMIYVQDEKQLEAAYGPEGAHTIKTNCDCQVYYAPRDEATQQNLSSRCGEMMLAQLNRTRLDGKVSEHWSSVKRTLIAPDETRMLHEENVIVFVANKPPLLGRRLNYLRHPLWRKAKLLPRLEIQDLAPRVLEAVSDKTQARAVPFPVSTTSLP